MSTSILLASSSSIEQLKVLIARYWCTKTEAIRIEENGQVFQNDKLMPHNIVVCKGGRYRFERVVQQ